MSLGAALGGAGIGLAGSLVNMGMQAAMNKKNLQFQKDVWKDQKAMYEQQRYDNANAVQIRAKDMEAGGFNKNLAAGASATSTAPVSITAPHGEAPQLDLSSTADKVASVAQEYFNLKQMKQNIANSEAQNRLLQAQADSTDAQRLKTIGETQNLPVQYKETLQKIELAKVEARKKEIEANKDWAEWQYNTDLGRNPNAGPSSNVFMDIGDRAMTGLSGIIKGFKNKPKNKKQPVFSDKPEKVHGDYW